jgi:trk system potassium uptake protein TrkH
MLLRPDVRDLRVIGSYLGRIADGIAVLIAVPALLALWLGEWNAATALLAGSGTALIIGQLARWRLRTTTPLGWGHGAVVVASGWMMGSLLAAVPFHLSGHYGRFLDAWFEGMSGLTATGLTLVQDLDHLPYSLNVYRHMLTFAGGLGIIIVVLALFAAGGGAATLYAAEAREQRLVPNIVRTAKWIAIIAGAYFVVGTIALSIVVRISGITGWRAPFHAVTLFLSAFATAGFAPTSKSIGYYHSLSVELVVLVLMVAGTFSFALHYQLWTGHRREVGRDIEVRTILVSLVLLVTLTLVGLALAGTYTDVTGLSRRGLFTALSAHTTTGFTVTDGSAFLTDWGTIAPFAIVAMMGLGGMAGSTAGGIKALRVGLVAKGVVHDIRRVLAPEAALVVTTFESGKRRILSTKLLRPATFILLLYVVTYLAGAFVGLLYGEWTLSETLFESTSAASSGGLSVGIVAPGMPIALQVTYILQMWVGRLEFVAVFALLGYALSIVRARS